MLPNAILHVLSFKISCLKLIGELVNSMKEGLLSFTVPVAFSTLNTVTDTLPKTVCWNKGWGEGARE